MTRYGQSPAVAWHISSYSQGAGANCVEAGPVLSGVDRVAVRDSTRRHAGMLTASTSAWRNFAGWAARQSA